MELNTNFNVNDIVWAYNPTDNSVSLKKVDGYIYGGVNSRHISDEILYSTYLYDSEQDAENIVKAIYIHRSCELFQTEEDALDYKEDMTPIWEQEKSEKENRLRRIDEILRNMDEQNEEPSEKEDSEKEEEKTEE